MSNRLFVTFAFLIISLFFFTQVPSAQAEYQSASFCNFTPDGSAKGDITISNSCVIYETVNGVAEGNLTLSPGAIVTLNHNLVFAPLKQINIGSDAKIYVNSGSSISQGKMCIRKGATGYPMVIGGSTIDPTTGLETTTSLTQLDMQPAIFTAPDIYTCPAVACTPQITTNCYDFRENYSSLAYVDTTGTGTELGSPDSDLLALGFEINDVNSALAAAGDVVVALPRNLIVNGKIGVGLTNPSTQLDVVGTGNFTGNITAPTLLGNVTGNITGNVTGNLTGNVTGNAATATNFSTDRTNYKGVTDTAVAGQLMWKHWGNGHTIFDASNSTSPGGTAISNTDPTTSWTATYPTLMGWNGTNTYGVRVDRAKLADTATALAANGANCTAGSFPLGVTAGGAVETCTTVSSLAPTLTGTGASGTWGISITGDAATTDGYSLNQSVMTTGTPTFSTLTVTGDISSNGISYYGDAKEIIKFSDAWLRLNPSLDFTTGIYAGTGVFRTDGILQVGASGADFIVTGGNVGVGKTNPSYKLHVVGTFYAGGSSRDYKTNISPLTLDSSKIYNLNPVSYDYKDQYKELGKKLSGGRQFGLIAEDVYKVYPELTLSDGTKNVANVDYEKLPILLLAEMKKQKAKIDNIEAENNSLKIKINSLDNRLKKLELNISR